MTRAASKPPPPGTPTPTGGKPGGSSRPPRDPKNPDNRPKPPRRLGDSARDHARRLAANLPLLTAAEAAEVGRLAAVLDTRRISGASSAA